MKAIIIDKFGNFWGPFDHGVAAAKWAQAKWPEQDQADDDGDGWHVAAIREPEL